MAYFGLMSSGIKLPRKILLARCLKMILLLVLFTPTLFVRADVSELVVSPVSPKQGDNVTFLIKGQPGEEVEVSISFTKKVAVSGGEYSWRLDDVYVPSTPNSVAVKAEDVETLHVSVKILIWVTKSVMAVSGVAEMSQSNVPKGTYDIWLHGKAAAGATEISLQITAKTTVTIGSDGRYTYNYDTQNIQVGTFTVKVGGITKSVTLSPRDTDSTPPSMTDPSPMGTINSFSPMISVNFTDESGIDVDSLRLFFNGREVTDSVIVTPSSMIFITEELGNGTVNHVALWISDIYGNEAYLEWDFRVVIPPREAQFVVTHVTPLSADVYVGQDMVVNVGVANMGELEGSYNITLLLNGELCFEDLVTLSGGESTILDYTFAELEEGFYHVIVGGLSEDFRVTSWAEESNRSVIVNEIESVSTIAAAKLMEVLSPAVALDVLGEVGVEKSFRIFEELDFYAAIDIIESAVQLDRTEEVSSLLLGFDENLSVALLLGVDSVSGAELTTSIRGMDYSACNEKIERAIKDDVYKSAEFLELVDVELLSEILLEIAWMPSTASTVSDLFEVMRVDRVFEIIHLWFDQGYLYTIDMVFNGLMSSRLEMIVERFTKSERLVLLSHLSTETSIRIRGGLLQLPDLVVHNIIVSMVEPMVYSIMVNVGNLGNAVSGPFFVNFSVDGVMFSSCRVETLSSDEFVDVDVIWEPEIYGEYRFDAEVDSIDEVIEFDESNNFWQLIFSVDRPNNSPDKYLLILLIVGIFGVAIFYCARRQIR